MWSVWLIYCDCGFHSVCPLMEKAKRLMKASWWERETEGETGPCSVTEVQANPIPEKDQFGARNGLRLWLPPQVEQTTSRSLFLLKLLNMLDKSGFHFLLLQRKTGPGKEWEFSKVMLTFFSRVRLFVTPWIVACQGPLSMGFPSTNTGMGCHFLLEGMFLTQRLNQHLLPLLH